MTQKSLDLKLARIHADPIRCQDFILADAKDADMALSIGAPGRSPEAHPGEVRYRSLAEFRDIIEQIVEQQLVDVMLMSASTSEVLTIHKRIFADSPVTPAARAMSSTWTWSKARAENWAAAASSMFRRRRWRHEGSLTTFIEMRLASSNFI